MRFGIGGWHMADFVATGKVGCALPKLYASLEIRSTHLLSGLERRLGSAK